uniref:Uncharacterized protein n=1 Tax=Anguilla anguilla TaxID=7936 RepID=A0A0E9P762_ANGAN
MLNYHLRRKFLEKVIANLKMN